jgi:type IV secretory pathway TraG/TraD family ATPase VirD4
MIVKKLIINFHFRFLRTKGHGLMFRGILVIGGAGSGKSHSVAEPIMEQAAQKGFAGIIYDFKFPTLTNFAYHHNYKEGRGVDFYVINFKDLAHTHRVNPLAPQYIPVAAYAEEYSTAIIANLMPETIGRKDFWVRSSTALLTATIWYLKRYYPQYCSIPHVVNLILSEDYHELLDLLRDDYECATIIRSIITAVDNKASDQIAGVISSLQVALAKINTQEICYVLSGDDFSLDINDPNHPKLLCIGTNPMLVESFSPLVSCICTVALKLMNQQGKRHSFVLLDEAPTIFIPKFDQIPATARSNKVATVFMAQDFSQIRKYYGQVEAQAIISNLNNQFYGRVASADTAEYVSKMIGKEDKLYHTESESNSRSSDWLNMSSSNYGGSQNNSVSSSLQERSVVKVQDVFNLSVGEFIGTTVETETPNFYAKIVRKIDSKPMKTLPIVNMAFDIELNFKKITLECRAILERVGENQPFFSGKYE